MHETEHRQNREKEKTQKKKWCIYGNSWNSALGCFSCSIIRLTVLRSFVWLHDSPSARLADRILMIHELRGSNLAHTKSSTSSAPLLCVYLSLVSCFVLSFTTLLWYPLTHKHWDIFLYSTLAFWYPPKKTGLSLVQHQSLGGTWEESECLTAFYTREQVLQDWNTEKKSLHLRHLGIFTEKRISLGFVTVFLLSRFGRRFLDWTMLRTRNGYKHLLLWILHNGGTFRTRGYNNTLTITHCVCASPL